MFVFTILLPYLWTLTILGWTELSWIVKDGKENTSRA